MQMRSLRAVAAAATLAFAGSAFANKADIVDTAVSAGQFNTLVTAVKEAGLVETLKGPGPYTVFAPNDAAFAKVPKAQLDALLKDKEKLAQVLKYHVVPGKVMAADVKSGKAPTALGKELTLAKNASGVRVNDSRVIKADVEASNGVIHVVDTVILP